MDRPRALKLNRSLGPWGDVPTGLELDFKQKDSKILGAKFNKEGGERGNWTDRLRKVKQKLGFWGLRRLTIEGKV